MSRIAKILMLVAVAALTAQLSRAARSDDNISFAGSAQLDYLLVPTDERARSFTFDGFTTELSLKLSVDVSDTISAQIKTCYGCHGFELGSAYVDFRITEEINFRAGRFVPKFGDFPVRHDPANHLTSDKPLPYDMGRMLHLRDWNMSILPAPYVDNGAEISARYGVEDVFDVDAAFYFVSGLKGNEDGADVDFLQSRSREFYYVDNNSLPSVGGRLAFSWYPADGVLLALGGSAFYGTYDPNNNLDFLLLGADLLLRIERFALRMEYLLRRTKMGVGNTPEDRFRYGPRSDGTYDPYFVKDGFYAEATYPIHEMFELVARFDGMRRLGNVTTGSTLRSESVVLRYTAGTNLVLQRAWRVKFSVEGYDFSDFQDQLAIHLGVVGAF